MIVNELDDHQIEYTYQMKKGISMVEGSISVIKQMKYPEELIEDICKKTYIENNFVINLVTPNNNK
jgi:hypothetical protein